MFEVKMQYPENTSEYMDRLSYRETHVKPDLSVCDDLVKTEMIHC